MSLPLNPVSIGAPNAAIAMITACPWTGRTLAAGLGPAGMDVVLTRSVSDVLPLLSDRGIEAVLLDGRAASSDVAECADSCRRIVAALPSTSRLPVMVLAGEPLPARDEAALLAAGACGVVSYPHGAARWIGHLVARIRANRTVRRRPLLADANGDAGLGDPAWLGRRAREADAMSGGMPVRAACAAFGIEATMPSGQRPGAEEVQRLLAVLHDVGRLSDVFCRRGDVEFTVLALGADAVAARAIVRRLDAAMAAAARPDGQQAARVVLRAIGEGCTASQAVRALHAILAVVE